MQLVILAVMLLAVPLLAGGVFVDLGRSCSGLLSRWVSGQMLLWAGFELISVPMILAERRFPEVVKLFLAYTAFVILLALVLETVRRKRSPVLLEMSRRKNLPAPETERQGGTSVLSIVLWCLAACLLLVQLVLSCLLAYEEGDDAFYVGISTATTESETMYRTLPYTGQGTGMDMRHALAPFPIWVSFLARMSGMHGAAVAQTVLPVVLIVMCYGIYYVIGTQLFRRGSRKLPLFMLLLECLVLFGGYSLYSAENFLLVRTAQGKAVLANIVLPFLLLQLYILLEKLQNGKSAGVRYWLMVACTMVTGCLCSTQGTQLTGMLLGIIGCCAVAAYRRWKLLLPMAGCCIIPGVVLFLYMRLG